MQTLLDEMGMSLSCGLLCDIGAANQWLSNTLATMKPYIGEGAYM